MSPAEENYQEILTHIRRSHFALVATTFALIAASTAPNSRTIGEASRQSEEIYKIASSNFYSLHDKDHSEYFFATKNDTLFSPNFNLRPTGDQGPAVIREGENCYEFVTSNDHKSKRLSISTASTIAEFESAWNFLLQATPTRITHLNYDVIYGDDDKLISQQGRSKIATTQTEGGQSCVYEFELHGSLRIESVNLPPPRHLQSAFLSNESNPKNFARFEIDWCDDGSRYDGEFAGCGIPYNIIKFPITVEPLTYNNGLQFLLPEALEESSRLSFSDAFPDFYQAVSAIKEAHIKSAKELLKEKLNATPSTLDVMGISIPRNNFKFLGVILISTIQIYFVLHLRQFYKINIPRRTLQMFPWIGNYGDYLPRKFYVISCTIFPIFCTGLLTFGPVESFLENAIKRILSLNFLCFVISCVAAWETFRDISKSGDRSRIRSPKVSQ